MSVLDLADALDKASQDRQKLRRETLAMLRKIEFDEADYYEASKFRRGYAADLVDQRITDLLRKYADKL